MEHEKVTRQRLQEIMQRAIDADPDCVNIGRVEIMFLEMDWAPAFHGLAPSDKAGAAAVDRIITSVWDRYEITDPKPTWDEKPAQSNPLH